MATAALVVGAVGTVASAGAAYMGAQQQAAAQKSTAAFNAQVARNNATIANQNAEYATQVGMAKAERESMRGRAAMGSIKAAQAASGIDTTFGSAADVQVGAREANVLDVSNVVQNAQLEAYGYRSQAANFQGQAGLQDLQGSQASSTAGSVSALGTLLSGASSLGTKWASMQPAKTDDLAGLSGANRLGSATYEKAWGE